MPPSLPSPPHEARRRGSAVPPAELVAYLEGLPEPHIVFDPDYRIVAANAAYRQQFSPGGSVLGRTCYEASHHFDRPCDEAGESCPRSLSRASGQRERVLHLHHTPQGEAYVNIELVPLTDEQGRPVFFVEKMEALRVAHGMPARQGLIGRSPAFQQMLERVARVAPSEAAVLLLGASGTGKELVAQAVHEASARRHAPWVVVDCSSLPQTLFESEVFGHERGAYTGAHSAKPGLVEAASGGTLFLDEVGDIPMDMQVKLLRLLETGTFRRVGGNELRRTDVRIVSATHRDLRQRIEQGLFREDLYYRLSTFPIRLPALRERRSDIPLLARALLERVAAHRRLQLTDDAVACLCGHDFRGNVRELRNVIERAALWTDGDRIDRHQIRLALDADALPDASSAASPSAVRARQGQAASWSDAELGKILAEWTGSRRELAIRLRVSERTLYRRLQRLEPAAGAGARAGDA